MLTMPMATSAISRPGPRIATMPIAIRRRRESQHDVHAAHEQAVEPAARVASDQPQDAARQQRQGDREHAHPQRNLRPEHDSAQDVSPEIVGPKQVRLRAP